MTCYVLKFVLKIHPGGAIEHQHQNAVRVVPLLEQVADAPG